MKKKIRLAYCLVGLDGGVGNLIINYLDHMNIDDYDIRIIAHDCSSDLYRYEYEKRGIRVIEIRSKRQSVIANIHDLRNALKGCDIVHAHMTLTNLFPLFAAWSVGIPVRISQSHLAGKKNIKSQILSLGTKVMATDYWACGKAAGNYLYGRSHYYILNNAIQLSDYYYDEQVRKQERNRYKITEQTLVVGHVGRFTEQKNHIFLLQIFAEFQKIYQDSVLVLIGEGELLDEVKSVVEKLKMTDRVIFMGAISDVNRKLQMMDVFLLPSLFEGLPVSAIEAQASGLPCLMSDTITNEVMINDNVECLSLNDSALKWAKVLKKMAGQERVINQERLLAAGLDIRAEAVKLDRTYHQLLDKGEK